MLTMIPRIAFWLMALGALLLLIRWIEGALMGPAMSRATRK